MRPPLTRSESLIWSDDSAKAAVITIFGLKCGWQDFVANQNLDINRNL
jgi:hypothetical protein